MGDNGGRAIMCVVSIEIEYKLGVYLPINKGRKVLVDDQVLRPEGAAS